MRRQLRPRASPTRQQHIRDACAGLGGGSINPLLEEAEEVGRQDVASQRTEPNNPPSSSVADSLMQAGATFRLSELLWTWIS